MKSRTCVLASVLVALSVMPSAAQTDPLHPELGVLVEKRVSAGTLRRSGQGLTRLRGRECFVVLPYHVNADPPDIVGFSDSTLYDSADILGVGGSRGRAHYVDGDPEKDWAILQVEPGGEGVCARWPSGGRVGAALNLTDAVVIRRTEGGNFEQIPVEIRRGFNDEEIELHPRKEGDSFTQGLSGSRVQVGNVVVAMVRSVASDGSTARAHRLDYLTQETRRRFFGKPIPPTGEALVLSFAVPGLGQYSANRGRSGRVWFFTAVGATAAAVFYPQNVERVRGAFDFNGVWREYTSIEREYPLRRFSPAVWLTGGAASALEAYISGRRRTREPGPRRSGPRALAPARIQVADDGGLSVALVEVRF